MSGSDWNKKSVAWRKGYQAAVLLKSRQSCPYNGPELRSEGFAGYEARVNPKQPIL